MGKNKKKSEKQTEKELLEQQLLKYQKIECIASIILSVVSILVVIVKAILSWLS